MLQAALKHVSKRKNEEAISYISSYQTLTVDKNSKRLVLIRAGALFYSTVSFQKKLVSKYTVPKVLTTYPT